MQVGMKYELEENRMEPKEKSPNLGELEWAVSRKLFTPTVAKCATLDAGQNGWRSWSKQVQWNLCDK